MQIVNKCYDSGVSVLNTVQKLCEKETDKNRQPESCAQMRMLSVSTAVELYCLVTILMLCYYAHAVGGGALSDATIRPSVCRSRLGQLGAQRLGQAT